MGEEFGAILPARAIGEPVGRGGLFLVVLEQLDRGGDGGERGADFMCHFAGDPGGGRDPLDLPELPLKFQGVGNIRKNEERGFEVVFSSKVGNCGDRQGNVRTVVRHGKGWCIRERKVGRVAIVFGKGAQIRYA